MTIPNESIPSPPDTFQENFRTFCRSQIREVLLRPDIEAYTRKVAERDNITNWPLTIVKSNNFKHRYLPADYQRNTVFKKELNTLLGNILKGEKSNFASFLRTGLGGENPPISPPKLTAIIGHVYTSMDPRFEAIPAEQIPSDERITLPRQA
ncbi:hypothetical protein PGTUg99_026985 [Puccinia graminis f. sp. tritici]|uniref:Uncharacterized protein n=1 Tax=Puccinia graminis f. sp. tritici TaxID=56615 RepID=A0A5B0N060_PUCGR|nr:hypothetical protein PGTUg99_026985 [Puccinia graminis f. sp. tritici]